MLWQYNYFNRYNRGEKEIIKYNGNVYDIHVIGEGKSVYLGCGIVCNNDLTLNTYEI